MVLLTWWRSSPVQYCLVHMEALTDASCSLGVLRVWESSSARCVFTQSLPNAEVSRAVQEDGNPLSLLYCLFLPLCNRLVTVTAEHNILFYQLPSLTVQQQVSAHPSPTHLRRTSQTLLPRCLESLHHPCSYFKTFGALMCFCWMPDSPAILIPLT